MLFCLLLFSIHGLIPPNTSYCISVIPPWNDQNGWFYNQFFGYIVIIISPGRLIIVTTTYKNSFPSSFCWVNMGTLWYTYNKNNGTSSCFINQSTVSYYFYGHFQVQTDGLLSKSDINYFYFHFQVRKL